MSNGPLVVCAANSTYFAVAGEPDRAVYLTGSHVNNNLHDGLGFGLDCPDTPEVFEFDAYLEFLVARGHNFARLWPVLPRLQRHRAPEIAVISSHVRHRAGPG